MGRTYTPAGLGFVLTRIWTYQPENSEQNLESIVSDLQPYLCNETEDPEEVFTIDQDGHLVIQCQRLTATLVSYDAIVWHLGEVYALANWEYSYHTSLPVRVPEPPYGWRNRSLHIWRYNAGTDISVIRDDLHSLVGSEEDPEQIISVDTEGKLIVQGTLATFELNDQGCLEWDTQGNPVVVSPEAAALRYNLADYTN